MLNKSIKQIIKKPTQSLLIFAMCVVVILIIVACQTSKESAFLFPSTNDDSVCVSVSCVFGGRVCVETC